MKELSGELKNIAWEAFRSAPGRVPSVEAACLAVGNAMVEQDRKQRMPASDVLIVTEKAPCKQPCTTWRYVDGEDNAICDDCGAPRPQDRKGPELTVQEAWQKYCNWSEGEGLFVMTLGSFEEFYRESRRSLSESQWAEVEKAMYAQGNTSGGWPQYIAGVRARLLPPKTPPTPEPKAEEPTIRALVMALALATEGETRGTGAAAMYLRMAQEKLRGKREGGQ